VDLQDKVVVVTGASRGIGRQIALEMGRRGARIVVAARTVNAGPTLPGTVGETVALIEGAGGTALAVECDVAAPEDLQRLVTTTVDTFGRLDVVINNAADMIGQDLETLVARMLGQPDRRPDGADSSEDGSSPLDPWLLQFATNVHGPYLLMGLAVPHLRAQGGGVIINMTSGSAEMVSVAWLASLSKEERIHRNDRVGYATTKAALNRLTNATAADLAADNIAVVAVDPGATRTEVADLLGSRGLLSTEHMVPMSRPVGTVLDIVTAADPMQFSGQVIRTEPR
jgi:NAD(P)-dependent dehydrogenase (short-subunit alcohol dehydrogenase family)